ncbi:winged helix-turn-helix domain-containing protein [Methanolobus vulcani]|uniref:Winged helix-turn-helix domain-containing protein n=1 Tax=Methanolobus vulcani TaxID=38026 RepID=A0A7Z8KRH7_9EURY|nr:winged helix-turn-helix domain-containing protein [Methanolobus vulcani]
MLSHGGCILKKKQLIDVIFASEKRKNVLLTLKDGQKEMKILLEKLDTNRPALLLQIRILEDHALVYQSGDAYGLTTIGKIVVDKMLPFLDTIEVLNKHSDYLTMHNTESIPDHLFRRINELRNSQIIEPNLVNTYETNKQFLEKAVVSSSLRVISTFIHPTFRELIVNHIDTNTDITIIVTRDLFDKLKSELTDELTDEFKNALHNKKINIYIYKKELKLFSLSICDECFVLRLPFSNNEFSSKHLYGCHPEAYRWSMDLFDHFMKDAVRITTI